MPENVGISSLTTSSCTMHDHYLKRGFFNNNLNMNTTDKEVSARSYN